MQLPTALLLTTTLALGAQAAPQAPGTATTTTAAAVPTYPFHKPRDDDAAAPTSSGQPQPPQPTAPPPSIPAAKPDVSGPESGYPFRAFGGASCSGDPQPGSPVAQPAAATVWTGASLRACWNHSDVGSVGVYPPADDTQGCGVWFFPEADCGVSGGGGGGGGAAGSGAGGTGSVDVGAAEGFCLSQEYTSLGWVCPGDGDQLGGIGE